MRWWLIDFELLSPLLCSNGVREFISASEVACQEPFCLFLLRLGIASSVDEGISLHQTAAISPTASHNFKDVGDPVVLRRKIRIGYFATL